MKAINISFGISDIVYFKLDKDQNQMIVISIWIKENNILYECRCSRNITAFYNGFELTTEQNTLYKVS